MEPRWTVRFRRTGDICLVWGCVLRAQDCIPAFTENPPFCASARGSALPASLCIMGLIPKSLTPAFPFLLSEKVNDNIKSVPTVLSNFNPKK